MDAGNFVGVRPHCVYSMFANRHPRRGSRRVDGRSVQKRERRPLADWRRSPIRSTLCSTNSESPSTDRKKQSGSKGGEEVRSHEPRPGTPRGVPCLGSLSIEREQVQHAERQGGRSVASASVVGGSLMPRRKPSLVSSRDNARSPMHLQRRMFVTGMLDRQGTGQKYCRRSKAAPTPGGE